MHNVSEVKKSKQSVDNVACNDCNILSVHVTRSHRYKCGAHDEELWTEARFQNKIKSGKSYYVCTLSVFWSNRWAVCFPCVQHMFDLH